MPNTNTFSPENKNDKLTSLTYPKKSRQQFSFKSRTKYLMSSLLLVLLTFGSITAKTNSRVLEDPVYEKDFKYKIAEGKEQSFSSLSGNATIAENDIHQVAVNASVSGELLTNDKDDEGDGQTVQSATYLDENGTVTNLPFGAATDIYDEAGTLAGSMTLFFNGSYDFAPAEDYVGLVPVQYVVVDDNSSPATDTATLRIEVLNNPSTNNTNNDVIAQDDTNTVEQGETVVSNIMSNDSDVDGGAVSLEEATALNASGAVITLTTTAQEIYDENNTLAGEASMDGNGNVIFIADAAFLGDVSVGYSITDGMDTDDATLVITVEPFSDTDNNTYTNDDSSIGLQGQPLNGNVLANDNDPENDTQSPTSAVSSSGVVIDGFLQEENYYTAIPGVGAIKIEPNGGYIFIPTADFVGTEYIVYTICDSGNPQACETATLYLTVLPTNTTVAQNDINQTPANTAVSGDVLTNDSDQEGDNQTVESATFLDASGAVTNLPLATATDIYDENGTLAGTIKLNADGSYDFDPAINYTGTAPVEYIMMDDNGNAATDAALLTIIVLPNATTDGSNNDVIAQDDTNTVEPGETVRNSVLENDSDPDGDGITMVSATASDGQGGTITLTGAGQDIYDENNVLAGQASIDGKGNIIFTADPNYEGEVPVNYTITDGTDTDEAVLVITVPPAIGMNNYTYVNDDANTGLQGVTLGGDVLANDYDPDSKFQNVVSAVSSDGTAIIPGGSAVTLDGVGTFQIAVDGTYTFVPTDDFTGTEVIEYTACDTGSPMACEAATLYLTVLETNTISATDDFNNTAYETPVQGDVSVNDNDLEGNNRTFSLEGVNGGMDPNDGAVSLNSDGTYTFTPAGGFAGETEFTYNTCDDGNPVMCTTATVYIEVLPEMDIANQPIIANPDANSLVVGQTGTGNILSNDVDPDNRDLEITTTLTSVTVSGVDVKGNAVADAGTLTINADGSYEFVPTGNFTGTITQPYTTCVTADSGICDSSVLIIEVTPDNGNSTFANDDAAITDAGIMVANNVLSNDFDSESDNQSVSTFLYDSNGDGKANEAGTLGTDVAVSGYDTDGNFVANAGTLNMDSNGGYTFLPTAGFTGNVTVPYTTCDDASTSVCDDATLVITVLGINRDYSDAPAAFGIAWHRTVANENGDRVVDGSDVWLGTGTSFETTNLESADAEMDTQDDAMSFGSGAGQFPEVMLPAEKYDVSITLNAATPGTEVFYGMWIDWNDTDGTIYNEFISGSATVNGETQVTATFTAPSFIGAVTNVRLRADDNELLQADYIGGRANGEVEDYQRNVALPVEMLYFEGNAKGCNNELNWATASEENNSHFIVEYSKDGREFEQLGKVEGAGNSAKVVEYAYTHRNIADAQNYYRLKQVDFDGAYEYSDIVFIKSDCENLAAGNINVYPNPSVGLVKAEITNESGVDKTVEIKVTDALGRVLSQKNVFIQTGLNIEEVDLYAYPNGMYMISIIENGTKVQTYPVRLAKNK